MTLLQLVTHLRVSLLDDTGGTGVDWTTIAEDDVEAHQLRWTNEELTSYINEAERKAARNAMLLRKSESAMDIDVVAGTAEYPYNSKIINIKTAELDSNGMQLFRAEIEDMLGTKGWRTKEGTPVRYIVDESSRTIRLYPIPEENDTIYLTYNRLPLTDLSWDTPSGEPEIPEEYQIDMLDYAAHMAYMKEEANTLDPNRSAFFYQKFRANFGEISAYAEERRRRTRNKPIRYRDFF